MKIKTDHKLEMEAQLKAWDAWINASAESNGAMPSNAVQVLSLHAGQNDESESMNGLNVASAKSWGEVRESADKIWDGLKSEFSAIHIKSS